MQPPDRKQASSAPLDSGSVLAEANRYKVLGGLQTLTKAALNRDVFQDLVVAHTSYIPVPEFGNGPGGLSVLLGREDGGFGDPLRIGTGGLTAVSTGDLDRNGDLPRVL
jgi:hypothetical protein